MKLTIYHDGQFWVGVAEENEGDKVKVVKHTFGAEPQNEEVVTFVNLSLPKLFEEAGASVPAPGTSKHKINPKRLSRKISREVKNVGVSTYAQQAVQLEREQRKKVRQAKSKKQKEIEKERKWQLKRKRAKAKHKGH
ncbi:MAG: DUF2992 family protein [Firmicutes bacterium]|nr:DUF2992 family protein [Bacillota bacterium]